MNPWKWCLGEDKNNIKQNSCLSFSLKDPMEPPLPQHHEQYLCYELGVEVLYSRVQRTKKRVISMTKPAK